MSQLSLVLVNPQYAQNVGFCSRACGNMGAGSLMAVSPECDLSDSKARQGAAGAQDHLESITVYEDYPQYLEKNSEGIRIAMTARSGKSRPTKPLPDLLKELAETNGMEVLRGTPIHIVLGPEDDGLSTSHIDACQFTASLPIYGDFKSLNLGHAAQLSLFIAQNFLLASDGVKNPMEESNASVPFEPKALISTWLEHLGFDLSSPKVNAALILSNMLKKSLPTLKEKQIFEKVIHQNLRKLKEGNNGNASGTN